MGFAREDEDDLVSEVGSADIAVVQPSLPIIVESEDIVDEDEKESHSSRFVDSKSFHIFLSQISPQNF